MSLSKFSIPSLPLWNPKFSHESLLRLSQTQQFQRGFQMQAISDGELGFPSFKKCYESGLVLGDVQRRGLPTYIGVDLASDKRPGNFIVAIALDPLTGRRFPVEVLHGAWTSPQTAGHIADVCSRHAVEFIMVENNAYQQSIIDWIKQEKGDFPLWFRVESHTTGKNKADPQYGLPGLEIEFKNQAWSIPSAEWAGHNSTCRCSWCEWSRQFSLYPRGAANDAVMASWFAIHAINKWGRMGQGGMDAGVDGLNDR